MSTNIYNATIDKLKDIGSGGGGDPEALEAIENTITSSSSKEAEGAITATKAHSGGDYFNLGGVFVKAIDDISVGDTLSEDVNYESTNIGAELERINSGLAGKASVSDVNGIQTALTIIDPDEGSGVITFGVDADGNYGYKKVGADTVTPFKGNDKEIYWVTVERTGSSINHRVIGYVISHKDLDIAIVYTSSSTAKIYVNYELIQQVSTSSINTEFENVVRLYMPNFPFYNIFQYASDSTYGSGYIIKWQSIKNQTLNAIKTHNNYPSNHNFGIKQQSVNIAKDDYVTVPITPTPNGPAFDTLQKLPSTGIYLEDMLFLKIMVED